MEPLLEAIRTATAAGAGEEARAAGATACRTILSALEAKAGEPLAQPIANASPIQAAVSMLKGMPPEQLLDFAISRLKAALPAGVEVPPVQQLRLPVLPLPPLRRTP